MYAAADVFIIAVPTPFKDKKIAELSYVYSACKSVASVLKKGNLIILESTVPVGTTRKLKVLIEAESGLVCSKDFFLAYCPERVLPGRIFKELVFNDRIIGGICNQSSELAKIFYKAFVKGKGKAIVVATGMSTEVGKIAKMIAEAPEEKTPLERELDYFGKRIGVVILVICFIVFLMTLVLVRESWVDALLLAIALAVAL